MKKIKIGVVGGTGYTGVELLRILASHEHAEVEIITSRTEEGIALADRFTNLRGIYDLCYSFPNVEKLKKCDLVFFATPHGVALTMAAELIASDVKVIDLAADFRLEDLSLWQQWYNKEPTTKKLMQNVSYGLPEFYRENIKKAKIIANPGCYPTSVLLGLMPLLTTKDLVSIESIIVDGKSGVSGAGRGANVAMLGSETSESFKAYGINGHRHHPEMVEKITQIQGKPVNLTFVPHLVPMVRGMESTIYVNLLNPIAPQIIQDCYEQAYRNEPFVDVMPQGSLPETRSVKGSNMCRMAIYCSPTSPNLLVITSVLDNLVKGAAGQAVQNMNIMFQLDETTGLKQVALLP